MPKFKIERVTETRDGKVTNDYYQVWILSYNYITSSEVYQHKLYVQAEDWEEFKKIVNEVK